MEMYQRKEVKMAPNSDTFPTTQEKMRRREKAKLGFLRN